MEKIIILDFNSGSAYVFEFPKHLTEASDFFDTEEAEEEGLTEGNCQYMVTNGEIKFKI